MRWRPYLTKEDIDGVMGNDDPLPNPIPGTGIDYDPSTNTYVKIRPGVSVRQWMDEAREVIIDLGKDGEPVGYDIQSASMHTDVIAEALALACSSMAAEPDLPDPIPSEINDKIAEGLA